MQGKAKYDGRQISGGGKGGHGYVMAHQNLSSFINFLVFFAIICDTENFLLDIFYYWLPKFFGLVSFIIDPLRINFWLCLAGFFFFL